MTPAKTTRSLLEAMLQQLREEQCAEEKNLKVQGIDLDERFSSFCDLLKNASEDLSIILSLLERDPDCVDANGYRRLCALIDYVEIACAVYSPRQCQVQNATVH